MKNGRSSDSSYRTCASAVDSGRPAASPRLSSQAVREAWSTSNSNSNSNSNDNDDDSNSNTSNSNSNSTTNLAETDWISADLERRLAADALLHRLPNGVRTKVVFAEVPQYTMIMT